MLRESRLPTYFWAEAVNTACYTQNCTLINKDHDKTSYEIMADKKPTLKYFHVFGAKCFVLKEGNELLGKFDVKAEESIYLGYSLESKAYRVYMIADQKVIKSLNVTFDDTKLVNLQREKDSEPLEFENLLDDPLDIIEPEIARTGPVVQGNADSGSNDGNGGNNDHNNHTETPSRTITNISESSSHGDSNSEGT